MNTYRITQITYADTQRHTEHYHINARRAPTRAEVREKLSIPIRDTLLVAKIEFPTWELPRVNEWVAPPRLDEEIRKYLGLPPYDQGHNTSFMEAYFLLHLKEQYGRALVQKVIQEMS